VPCCCLTELNAKPAPLNFKSYHTVSTTQSVPHCCAVWIQAARRANEKEARLVCGMVCSARLLGHSIHLGKPAERERERDRETEIQTDRPIERQRYVCTSRHRDRETGSQRDRETDSQTETPRDIYREKDFERERVAHGAAGADGAQPRGAPAEEASRPRRRGRGRRRPCEEHRALIVLHVLTVHECLHTKDACGHTRMLQAQLL
jgi:hypothetical protein